MKIRSRQRQQSLMRGFTLVEMLISVALVLLMMTLFTSIFQMATDSMTVQRGVAATDQKARAFTTVLRSDIAKRSHRVVQPFYPTEDPSVGATSFGDRAGYLYISTNDPSSDLDNVLQFTVTANRTEESVDDSEYFGRAELLYNWEQDPLFNNGQRNTTLRFNPNQPDADDGSLFSNKVASSPAAEISYFIRGGNLYRRVMLLRNPLPIAGEELSAQPTSTSGDDYFGTPTGSAGPFFCFVGDPLEVNQTDASDANFFNLAVDETVPDAWQVHVSNDFWRHFDFSAVPTLTGGIPTGVDFLSLEALDNSNLGPGAAVLGDPRFRFGFNRVTGLSREHDNPVEWQFIGRYTQAETSSRLFNWPLALARTGTASTPPNDDDQPVNSGSDLSTGIGNLNTGLLLGDGDLSNPGTVSGSGNPMDIAGCQLRLNPQTGVVNELSETVTGRGGDRAVEDLLLANVHSMKIEIWDERAHRFVPPGHTVFGRAAGASVQGDFHRGRQANLGYGPRGTLAPLGNRVFDTWTAAGADFDFDGDGTTGEVLERQAPFTPYRYYPPRLGDSPSGPCPDTMTDPALEPDQETGLAQNQGFWSGVDGGGTRNTYMAGDVVFAVPTEFVRRGVVGWDADADGAFSWDSDQSTLLLDGTGTRTITNPGFPPQGFHIAYRCIQGGVVGDDPPNWPRVPGQKFAENLPAGVTQPPAQWVSIDNRRPLKSIRVTVQFFDENTEKLRQLSLTLPLTTDR